MNFTTYSVLNSTANYDTHATVSSVLTETSSVLSQATPEDNSYQDSTLPTDTAYSDPKPACSNTLTSSGISNITVNDSTQCDWIVVSDRNSIDMTKTSFSNIALTSQPPRDQNLTPLWNGKVMQNSATMTEWEVLDNCTQKNDTQLSKLTDLNASSSPNTEWEGCSITHLQRQEIAMAEYLARLQPPSLPLSIQEFLSRINIKVTQVSELKGNVELKPNREPVNTNLDGLPKSLFCLECRSSYTNEERLKAHMDVHKSERKFECNICGACLKRKEHLDQHKRRHSEERPFVCTVCCKGFKRNEHLRRHAIIHSGNKMYSCLECSKSFSRKDHLNKHTQTHVSKRVKIKLNI